MGLHQTQNFCTAKRKQRQPINQGKHLLRTNTPNKLISKIYKELKQLKKNNPIKIARGHSFQNGERPKAVAPRLAPRFSGS